MLIRIKNLRLRAIIGVNPWERSEKQSVIINVEIEFDGTAAAVSDKIEDTLDYRNISKTIIDHVESSQYQLIESLAAELLKIVLADKRVVRAEIEVDKPKAVKSADSTSVVVSGANC